MAATIELSNLNIAENPDVGTVIGTLTVTGGAEGETFTFALTDTFSDRFEIKEVVVDGVTSYQLVVKTSVDPTSSTSLFDFENPDLDDFPLQIKATGSQNTTVDAGSFTITVTDVKEQTGTNKNNVLTGTTDADELHGLGGNDRLIGDAGNDKLFGDAGNDKLFGGDGDDVLNGGLGKDFYYGGAGKDTFVFDTPVKKGHFDMVMDFVSADDTLVFSLAAINSITMKSGKDVITGGSLFSAGKLNADSFKLKGKGSVQDVNDYITYDQKNGFVYLDLDGSGKKHHGVAILKLKPGTALSADDFLFI